MAATSNAAPGTEYGPCAGICSHRDCADTRATAQVKCTACDKVIGYGQPFYRDNPDGVTDWKKLIHASCAVDREEDRRRTAAQ
jgi:hypothetical protein